MKREDVIYYGLLFAAGVGVALWFRKEYKDMKQAAIQNPKKTSYTVFGVRG
jgi:hypothetical protein